MRLLTAIILLSCAISTRGGRKKALDFLKKFNEVAVPKFYKLIQSNWQYYTNMNEETLKVAQEAHIEFEEWKEKNNEIARKIDLKGVGPREARQFQLILSSPPMSQNQTVVKSTIKVKSALKEIFEYANITLNSKFVKTIDAKSKKGDKTLKVLKLNPHIDEIMRKSTDPKELLYIWEEFRKATGSKMPDLYTEMVRLQNIGAVEHGWEDMGDYWRRGQYEVDNIQEMVDQMWEELKPLYEEVYGYVRFRLSKIYPDLVKDGEMIPAHLVGEISSMYWFNLHERIKPFSEYSKTFHSNEIDALIEE